MYFLVDFFGDVNVIHCVTIVLYEDLERHGSLLTS